MRTFPKSTKCDADVASIKPFPRSFLAIKKCLYNRPYSRHVFIRFGLRLRAYPRN